jgi:hypothetical protein
MTPFLDRETGRIVIGEVCECGHPKAVHGSKIRGGIRVEEAGNCCVMDKPCKCVKYRWAGWIYEAAPFMPQSGLVSAHRQMSTALQSLRRERQ